MSNELAVEIKTNRFFLIVIIMSFIALVASYSAEYIFQKIPCQLCNLERLPYFGMLIIGMIGLSAFDKKAPLIILLGICAISLILGAYHYGVQQNIFKDFCKGSAVSTIEDYRNMLNSPTCSKVSFSIFGIPATLINFFISLSFILMTSLRIYDYRKKLI